MWDGNSVYPASAGPERAEEDPSHIEAFLEELGGLPLAIGQMAARASFTDNSA